MPQKFHEARSGVVHTQFSAQSSCRSHGVASASGTSRGDTAGSAGAS